MSLMVPCCVGVKCRGATECRSRSHWTEKEDQSEPGYQWLSRLHHIILHTYSYQHRYFRDTHYSVYLTNTKICHVTIDTFFKFLNDMKDLSNKKLCWIKIIPQIAVYKIEMASLSTAIHNYFFKTISGWVKTISAFKRGQIHIFILREVWKK